MYIHLYINVALFLDNHKKLSTLHLHILH